MREQQSELVGFETDDAEVVANSATISLVVQITHAVFVFLALTDASAQSDFPRFMGREVTIIKPEMDPNGYFPNGPASVCIEELPQRQCYTAPKDFGRDPKAALVQIEKDMPAILFSAASGGVSGWGIHFALLRPGTGKELEDVFLGGIELSNQSEHEFWTDPSISDAAIFVTANFVWGRDEGHYQEHRYIVSAYIRKHSSLLDGDYYYLEDQYMTVRKYDQDANQDILAGEKPEILSRLNRVRAETEKQQSRR